jgi:transposase
MVAGTLGANRKEGSMEQVQSSILNGGVDVGGVDVGNHRLDGAIEGMGSQLETGNDPQGIAKLVDWFVEHGVGRVGIEATGGYERKLRAALEAAGIAVVVHQPLEVKLYGRLVRQQAKTDACDARLIAAATAAIKRQPRAGDPLLTQLSERLTAYEKIADMLMSLKTFKESLSLGDLGQMADDQIAHLTRLKRGLALALVKAIKADPKLRSRYDLLISLPGIGPIVAASLVIRMPELGSMQRGQAASLIGVAPHARDSGTHKGERFISGGRSRPRRMLYLAALAARRYDNSLKGFADRLRTAGKPPKLVIVAIMRKLIETANLVLKRAQPWAKQRP